MTSIDATVVVVDRIKTVTFAEPVRLGELTTDPITAEGVTRVDFVATDAAGNVKTAFATVSIDNTKPS